MKAKTSLIVCLTLMLSIFSTSTFAQKNDRKNVAGAYLEITLKVNDADRASATGVYTKYKAPFLKEIKGAVSKELLIRSEDVKVLHGFETQAEAEAYLKSKLFREDVVVGLKPYLQADPEIRIYSVFNH